MKKIKTILIILAVVSAFVAYNLYFNDKDNASPQGQKTPSSSAEKKQKDVKPIRIEKYLSFTKDEKHFTLDPIEVTKDNTENKMGIFLSGTNVENNIKITVSCDDKVIFNGVYKGDGMQIPYEVKDKSALKLSLDYLGDIKEKDDPNNYYTRVAWYVNRMP